MARTLALLALCALVTASALGGCRRAHGIATPAPADVRWQRRLEGVARRDLGCHVVRLVPLNDSVFQADGCGHLVEYEMLCAGRHCSWHRIEPAALRAARELGCPLGNMSATVPSATRRDFAGCGRAASYTLGCGAAHCEWTGTATAAAPAAATGGYGAPGAPPAVGAPATVTPPGYGGGAGAAPGTYAGDPALESVAIPPPPSADAATPAAPSGGATTPGAEPPQDITALPPSSSSETTDGAATAPGAESTEDATIPPPPP